MPKSPPQTAEPGAHQAADANSRPFASKLGSAVLGQLEQLRGVTALFRQTLYYCVRSKTPLADVASQAYTIGNQSLVFLVFVMGFIGMIIVFQAGLQLQRIIPDTSQLGTTFLELLIKDLSPTVSALMLATRVGAGIAAEIGAMVVTEQIDALRMCAADPVDYLIRPRFIASLIMTLVLVIIATTVAAATGALAAGVFFSGPSRDVSRFQPGRRGRSN